MIKQIVKTVITSFGYDLVKSSKPSQITEYPFINTLELILESYPVQNSDFFIVQIGAHDGASADPICQLIKKNHWRGLLIEPQRKPFDQLKETYQEETQISLENILIGKEDGTATLYTVRYEKDLMPFWLSQAASLDRSMVSGMLYYFKFVENLETLPEDYESLIEEQTIPSMTVNTLISKHAIKKIDLLVIDTVGFDFEILKMVPFDTLKPNIIHFEHSLLSPEDQMSCFKLLTALGYGLTQVAVDTIAYLNAPIRQGKYVVSSQV